MAEKLIDHQHLVHLVVMRLSLLEIWYAPIIALMSLLQSLNKVIILQLDTVNLDGLQVIGKSQDCD